MKIPRPFLQLLETPPSPQVTAANGKPISEKKPSRINRDALLKSINRRRAAIQNSVALWPASEESRRPICKIFSLSLNRAIGL